MSKRKAITPKMKVDTLLAQVFRQFGKHLLCPLSQIEMLPGDDIEFDHIHCVELDGPHAYQNLRAVHIGAHKKKTKADRRMIKKANNPKRTEKFAVKRTVLWFEGEEIELEPPKLIPKRQWPKGRKLQSRPFNGGKTNAA